jgi:hypothetical protein
MIFIRIRILAHKKFVLIFSIKKKMFGLKITYI